MSCGDIFLGFLAILFPPIAVWIKRGICSADSLINILLSCLGYMPGLIHAWYIIARFPEDDLSGEYEAIPDESGRITYYYVAHQPPPHGGPPSGGSPATGAPDGGHAHRQQQRGASSGAYGTLNASSQPQQAQQPPQQRQDAPQQGPADGSTPPTYAEAVRGDHKIQTV